MKIYGTEGVVLFIRRKKKNKKTCEPPTHSLSLTHHIQTQKKYHVYYKEGKIKASSANDALVQTVEHFRGKGGKKLNARSMYQSLSNRRDLEGK